jgi:di/tricarboxylate transporter
MLLPEVLLAATGWQAWLVIGLLILVVVLFARETLRFDLVGVLGLALLMIFGVLTPEQAFAGFGSPIIVMLGAVFIIGGALQETAVLDLIGERLVRVLPRGEGWLVLGIMLVAATLSAFMNNTSVTAMLVPLVIGLAKRSAVSPSRLLLPMAFASILGGTCTLIGTSTNLAVSASISARAGLQPFGLFEMTGLGMAFVGFGIAFMVLIGRHLLPRHAEEDLASDFGSRGFLSEIVLLPHSTIVGRRVAESDFSKLDFRILKVVRGGRGFVPDAETVLAAGDVLLVTGEIGELLKVKATEGIEIRPELKLGPADLKNAGLELAEVVVSPRSAIVGRTLKEVRFQQEYGLTVLALYRLGKALRDRISRIRLAAGDLLLVQGRPEALETVRRRRDIAVLAERGAAHPALRKPAVALAIFVGALVLGGFGWVSLPAAFFVAALAMVLTGCLRPIRLYDYVEWRLLVLIGSMLAFGKAMEISGGADLLAEGVVRLLGGMGPLWIVGGYCIVTVLLTQPMSNAAAALVVLPVALQSAERLGMEPRAVALAIMLSASFSVATPLEPSCVLVYGPGKYRFVDFLKVGVPLTLLLVALLLWLLPLGWPLNSR